MDRPNHLHLIDIDAIERRLRDDRPVQLEIAGPSSFATLAADWREFWNEVAEAPAHHAAFAILILVSVALLFVAPLIVAGWVK